MTTTPPTTEPNCPAARPAGTTTRKSTPMTTHATEPTTDTRPAEFASFIVGHLGGRVHDQVSEEMHTLLAAVAAHGKKGSLTITVTVEPPKGAVDGGPVTIAVESAVKAPKPVAPPAIYFLDSDGNATRNDPRQTAAGIFRSADGAAEFRMADTTTGEFRTAE